MLHHKSVAESELGAHAAEMEREKQTHTIPGHLLIRTRSLMLPLRHRGNPITLTSFLFVLDFKLLLRDD